MIVCFVSAGTSIQPGVLKLNLAAVNGLEWQRYTLLPQQQNSCAFNVFLTTDINRA